MPVDRQSVNPSCPGVDAPGGDYHLASGSAAIDAGVAEYSGEAAPADDHDGSARPQGSTWDVGAYERLTHAFTITLKRLIRTATGKKKAKILWNDTDLSTGKIDFYIDRAPDGNPDKRGRNDGSMKVKINAPGDGPFDIQACEKNSTTFCSNVVTADFTGVPIDLNEPDDDKDEEAAAKSGAEELPEVFALQGNYPNPFNPSTTIRFNLTEPADVRLEVIDVLGRKVMTLPAQRFQAGAGHSFSVDASSLASGIYLYRVTAETSTHTLRHTGRMILSK